MSGKKPSQTQIVVPKKPDMTRVAANLGRSDSGNDEVAKLLAMGELRSVDLSLVDRDEDQPRPIEEVMDGIEEFADDLERDKFILAQYPVYHEKPDGRYMIVVGERRTVAFKLKGQEKILANVKKFTQSELDTLTIRQYAENDGKLKKELSPLADARWWRKFADRFHGGNASDAALARGYTAQDVSNRLSILEAPEILVKFILTDKIKDPATIAGLNRYYRRAGEEKVAMLINAYRNDDIHGSLRSFVEKLNRENKIAHASGKPGKKSHALDGVGVHGVSVGLGEQANLDSSTDTEKPKDWDVKDVGTGCSNQEYSAAAKELGGIKKRLASFALLNVAANRNEVLAVLEDAELIISRLKKHLLNSK